MQRELIEIFSSSSELTYVALLIDGLANDIHDTPKGGPTNRHLITKNYTNKLIKNLAGFKLGRKINRHPPQYAQQKKAEVSGSNPIRNSLRVES